VRAYKHGTDWSNLRVEPFLSAWEYPWIGVTIAATVNKDQTHKCKESYTILPMILFSVVLL
jgi:hypothetical protein